MSVKININGDGLSYSTDTTIIKASQIIAFLNAASSDMVDTSPQQLDAPQFSSNKYESKSPRDALIDSEAKTNMEKILVFAKYHMEKSGNIVFNPSDLKIYFKRAGEPEPGNYSRDVRDAIALNFIYEETSGDYVITDYGNEVLENGFKNVSKTKPVKKKQSPVKGISKTANVSAEVMNLDVIPKMEGIASYHSLNKKGDRILWILYFGYQNSLSELTGADIEYIANRLDDDISGKNVNALTEKGRKDAYLTKKDNKYKILYDGIDYMKKINKEGEHIQE